MMAQPPMPQIQDPNALIQAMAGEQVVPPEAQQGNVEQYNLGGIAGNQAGV